MGGNPTKLDSYHGGSASGYGSHSYAESYVDSERRRAHSRYTRIGDDYSSLDQISFHSYILKLLGIHKSFNLNMGGNPTKLDSYHGGSVSGYGSHSYAESYVNSERRRAHSRYTRIGDDYSSLDQVTEALTQAGLESSNLIVGIDFTKSNEWTGARSFNRKSLHHLGDSPNPYEQAISIIGRTIATFDEDNLIPCYGFGDATTHDQEVFSFYPDDKPCNGFEEALSRYRELVPQICLSGPTSFAPMIETATTIVDASGGQYHVLLIIADGQVTQSAGTKIGKLSSQEKNTINAIAKASEFPLSIVLVGVGDGPWDMMHQFDDNIPCRTFDNFQFVNFTEIMSRNTTISKKEAAFALAALMEIPSQYKATIDLHLLGCRKGIPGRIRLPPPIRNYKSTKNTKVCHTTSSAPTESNPQNKICPACLWNKKDLAFGCGHQMCNDCGKNLNLCPICQTHITTRIRLY